MLYFSAVNSRFYYGLRGRRQKSQRIPYKLG